MAAAASALAVLGVVGALPWQALLARRWGTGLLYAWSVADIALITLLIVWSGGGQSQLWLLYALTSLFFAACYQPRGQCVLGALTAGGYFAALADTGWNVTVADLTLRSTGLLLVTLMASFLSREKEHEASVSDHRSALLATVAGAARDLSVLGPDEVLSGVIGTVTALGFDGASISIIDERLGTYRVAYTWDMPPEYVGSVHPIGTGVTGMVLEAGATVGVDDYETHERGVDLVRVAGFHAVVGCPLHVAGEIAGVLSAGRKSDRPLCNQDVEAFELLAALASRALENARRYADLAESEARTRHQAQHDALTGLANRTLLRERILAALRQPRRAGRVTALIFIDLDDFKAVNDALGHGAGDVLLVEVAERIGSELRDGDAAARLGGDEFAVLLASVDPDTVGRIAERLLESITAPIHVLGTTVTTHASMGVAITERAEVGAVSKDRSEAAVDLLLRDADVAMYEAKQTGGCHVLFEQGMRQRLLERLTLETDLPGAIRHGDLSLVYQPIFDLDTGRLEGVEALLRWSHPDRGPIPPDVFIPLAESTGQIIPMGRWVLREACEQLQAWREEYPGCAD
ncbi:MAG: putative bifunctional diguanylate cyclase/phosphodiesterase, partial [Actinomycetes bacterium]